MTRPSPPPTDDPFPVSVATTAWRAEAATRLVEVTFAVPADAPPSATLWQTAVALDASASMKGHYGRNLAGELAGPFRKDCLKRGWVKEAVHDGRSVVTFAPEAIDEALAQGHLTRTEDRVGPVARALLELLAGEIDTAGSTTVVYSSCGEDGTEVEPVGDVRPDDLGALELAGPVRACFGNATRLVPAVRHFLALSSGDEQGLAFFVTDGRIDDLDELKLLTTEVAQEISLGRRLPVKWVLLGVGPDVSRPALDALDHLETGTAYDLWDAAVVGGPDAVRDVVRATVGSAHVVAPAGVVLDAAGRVVRTYDRGLPAKVRFRLPPADDRFGLEVAGRRRTISLDDT